MSRRFEVRRDTQRRDTQRRRRPVSGPTLAAMLLAPLAAGLAAPARAEVVSRTMQEDADFAERYGPDERIKTPSDARLQLYAETAEECRRLEALSNLACQVERLVLRLEERSGRPAVAGSVRFLLRPRGDDAAKPPRPDDAAPDRKPGDPR